MRHNAGHPALMGADADENRSCPGLHPAAGHHGQAQTGESRCITALKAEQARIEREAMARAPAPGSDQATQQRFMQGVHTQLNAAADRAEACESTSRPKAGSPTAQAFAARAQQCTDQANRELDQIKLPPQPSFEQQRAYREAGTRILDARMECQRRAR